MHAARKDWFINVESQELNINQPKPVQGIKTPIPGQPAERKLLSSRKI